MVIEIQCLEKKANNMLIEPDWLNVLVDKDENKVTSTKQTKNDFAAVCLNKVGLLHY